MSAADLRRLFTRTVLLSLISALALSTPLTSTPTFATETVSTEATSDTSSTPLEPFDTGGVPIFGNCSALSTFDSDNEGWRFATTNSGGQTIRSNPRPIDWQPDVGNPDGALIGFDPDAGWSEVWTPELEENGYTTDYRFTVGSSVGFDYKNNTGIAYDIYMSVKGTNGTIYWYNFRDQIVDSTQWTRVVVPIDPSEWRTQFNNGSGVINDSPSPTPDEFSAALADVERFSFSVEGRHGSDTTIFDNFGMPCEDFGDAPSSYGTTLAEGGPAHSLVGYSYETDTAALMLGTRVDFEDDGLLGEAALGDDVSGLNDEDGVADPIIVTTGSETTVSVVATNTSGSVATLAGWVDLDGNGTFDPGERVTISVPANSGTQTYELTFPPGTTVSDTYARFRIFSGDVSDPLPGGRVSGGEVEDYAVQVLSPALEIEKTSNFTSDSRPGDTIEYTVTATNTGAADFTDSVPAVVFDDLADVLDDADFDVANASADQPGAIDFADDVLEWQGALAVGDTVTLTYEVTLKAGGDGEVRNVAWHPEDPGDRETPECAEDDLACDTTNGELPRLNVEKEASSDAFTQTGDTVTYSVRVTNPGRGDFTEDAPATMTDDLSDVLASGELVGAPSADIGEVSLNPETDVLGWTGALEAGQTATVTYEVRYTATYENEQDSLLENTACVPEELLAPGAEACASVDVPGPVLSHWKTVDSDDNPVVAGSTVRYTLHFENSGEAPATVNTVDHLDFVLDDADLMLESHVGALGVTPTGSTIVISGILPAGATETITYTVIPRADGARTDSVMSNFLLTEGEEPPADGVCVPTEDERPDCTTTLVSASMLLEKRGQGPTGEIPLAGAEFDLTPEDGAAILVTDESIAGVFFVEGLFPGEHTLTETRAPAGYTLLADSIEFQVLPSGAISADETDTVRIESDGDGTWRLIINDVSAFELPMSGGFGNLPWILGGLLLAGAALTISLVRARREQNTSAHA